MDLDHQFYSYYNTRNSQIAEFKKDGLSWEQIATKMGLSREYVKQLGHKQGVYGPQKKFKAPVHKCPMCGQAII